MNKTTKIRAMAATIFAVIGAGAYLATQYAAAQKPASLNNLPTYPFAGSVYSIDDIAPAERARAEASLRHVADTIAPGYRPVAERFLAAEGDFTWDAVRSTVGGYLSRTGFHIRDAGQTPHSNDDAAFIVWDRTNRLQHAINPGQMLAVGLQDPLRDGPPDQQVHIYAYFELAPESKPVAEEQS